MSIAEAVILGLLQALGEFLPISSSAHLVLLPFFRGVQYQGVSFDVMLHLATLLAVLLYFAKDWFVIIKDGLTRPKTREGKTLWLLALATVPAGLAGVLGQDAIETVFRSPLSIAACLMVFAVILWLADRKADPQRNYHYGGAVSGILTQSERAHILFAFRPRYRRGGGAGAGPPFAGGYYRAAGVGVYQRVFGCAAGHRRADEIH